MLVVQLPTVPSTVGDFTTPDSHSVGQERIAESERAAMSNVLTPDPRAKAAAQIGLLGNSVQSEGKLGAGLEHAGRGVGVGDGEEK
jgi:hypothetical protein